jgi:MFS family permease
MEVTRSEQDGSAPDPRSAVEQAFQSQVRDNLGRNYAVHLVHGLLGQTGFRIIVAPTFIPAYIFGLSGSNLVVGIARACTALGMFLPPILGAAIIEQRRRVLPLGFVIGALMRLQILGLALCGFFLATRVNLVMICVLLGLFGFFTGMQAVIFNFLVSKVIPVERRGRLIGFRNGLAALTASGVGFLGGKLVDMNALGNGYASLFLLSFALTAAGLCVLIFMREPASPAVKPRSPLGKRFAQLPALLRSDGAYAMYVLARALSAAGRLSMPYYVIFAGTRLDLTGDRIGILTVAFLIAPAVANVLWGFIADRYGFRLGFILALVCWIGSALLVMAGHTLGLSIAAFILLGMGFGGFQLSSNNLVFEFGSIEDRPMRIAIAQTAEQSMAIVAPLVGGLIAETLSYYHLFWTAVAVQAAALLVVIFKVDEPRRRKIAPPIDRSENTAEE